MAKKKDYTEEYVQINGIRQYFLHYPSPQKEVVIFLHGGPGSPSSAFGYEVKKQWDFCSLVYYDQRGSGKTLKKNKTKAEDLSLDVMIADLKETISYIKQKYQTDRVILLGQSWGSVLGTQYVLRYPVDVVAFIATGVVVDTRQGMMRVSYDKLKETLISKDAKKDLKKLATLGDYPNVDKENFNEHVIVFQKLQSKHGHSVDIGKMVKLGMKSPVFKLSDIYYMPKGSNLSAKLFIDAVLEYSILDIKDYKLPVYYLLGRNDWQVPSTSAAEYFEKINAPHKALYWIEDAGHVVDVENTKDYCKAVREILLGLPQ